MLGREIEVAEQHLAVLEQLLDSLRVLGAVRLLEAVNRRLGRLFVPAVVLRLSTAAQRPPSAGADTGDRLTDSDALAVWLPPDG